MCLRVKQCPCIVKLVFVKTWAWTFAEGANGIIWQNDGVLAVIWWKLGI